MKYIKEKESYIGIYNNPKLSELKKLLNHLTNVFHELGFDYCNYINNGEYEVEFNKGDDLFYIVLSLRAEGLLLQIKKASTFGSNFLHFIPEYFKSVEGLKKLETINSTINSITFKINNVESIIEQVTVEDIEKRYKISKYKL